MTFRPASVYLVAERGGRAMPERPFCPRRDGDYMERTVHPNGCRCSSCYGFAEFMDQVTGREYGLPRAPGCEHAESAKLHVLTFGKLPANAVPIPAAGDEACEGDDSMTCTCSRHTAERLRLVRRGGVGSGAHQPYVPRPSRSLRKAA